MTKSRLNAVVYVVARCAILFSVLVSSLTIAKAAGVDVNARSVGLVAGDDAWMARISSVAQQLNNDNGLRVLPIASAGCMQSVVDVLRLDHVDVSLLTTDCVTYVEQQGLIPKALDKLAYLARVESLPIVLVTRKTTTTLTQLAGQRIATGPADSAAFATGELVLGGLGLPFKRVPKAGVNAIMALQEGKADAALLLGLDQLPSSFDSNEFHALGLSAPPTLSDIYSPMLIERAAMRGLSAEASFETIAVALTLVALRKANAAVKSKRVKLFASVYFKNQYERGNGSQLSTHIAGWQRHAASEAALQTLEDIKQPLQQGDQP